MFQTTCWYQTSYLKGPVLYEENLERIFLQKAIFHYDDFIMGTIASQITSLAIVYSIVYSSAHQGKHQSSASLAFVLGIHRGPVNSPHKWPVTRKMFPFDDVIMLSVYLSVFLGTRQSAVLEFRIRLISSITSTTQAPISWDVYTWKWGLQQYVTLSIPTVVLYFIWLRICCQSKWVDVIHLPISIRMVSLALG